MPHESKPKLSAAEKALATKRRQFANLKEREASAELGHKRNAYTKKLNECRREIQLLAAQVRQEQNDVLIKEMQDNDSPTP